MKKAEVMISFFFFIVVFIFIWIIFLSNYLNIIGEMLLDTGEVGILAFVYGNLNLLVLIGLVILISVGWYTVR